MKNGQKPCQFENKWAAMSSKFIKKSYLRSRSGPLFTQNDPPERKKECCGCGACTESCPARCIRMEEDAEGFLYPAVQADACTGCGLCERICPMRHPRPNTRRRRCGPHGTTIWPPAPAVRQAASSAYLARLTLRKGGLVFGAAFESDTFGKGDNPAPQRHMRGGTRGTRQIQIRTKRYVRNLPGGSPRP